GDSVTLGTDTIVTGVGITFSSTVQSPTTAHSLTVNDSATTTFAGAVGGSGNPLSSLTTNSGGTTAINGGAVTTSGAQHYGDDVTLGNPTTISTGTTASFDGQITGGANSLTISGNAVLGDGSGTDTVTAGSLSVSGTTNIKTDTITTAGTQTYSGAVTVTSTTGASTLGTTNSAVLFGSTTTLAGNLTVNAGSGSITF